MIDCPLWAEPDVWKYDWGEKYLPSKHYTHVHAHLVAPAVFKWLWKSVCVLKTKVFAWLLLNDWLNTRDLLVRQNWKVSEETFASPSLWKWWF
jgi:hypothetical protein